MTTDWPPAPQAADGWRTLLGTIFPVLRRHHRLAAPPASPGLQRGYYISRIPVPSRRGMPHPTKRIPGPSASTPVAARSDTPYRPPTRAPNRTLLASYPWFPRRLLLPRLGKHHEDQDLFVSLGPTLKSLQTTVDLGFWVGYDQPI